MHKGQRTSLKSLIRFKCGFQVGGKGMITYLKASFLRGFQQFVRLRMRRLARSTSLDSEMCFVILHIQYPIINRNGK